MPFSLQEMLSSAPQPTPLRQEPKAPCFSEPACGSRPPGSDPRLGLGTDRAERGGSRQGVRPGCPAPGAACRVGRSSQPIPLRSCPIPKQYTPPPAGPLPTLRGAASPAACRRWPRAAQAASERASGALWDGTRRKRRKRRQRQHLGLFPRLPRAIPEESRGSRSGEEASDEDPGVCAPVSLPRRRRWLQVSGARSPRGPAWPRSPEAQTDRRTDRAWAPTHAGAPKGPRPGPCGPARPLPSDAPSRPGPLAPEPSGQRARGRAALRDPPAGASWAALAGRAPRAP